MPLDLTSSFEVIDPRFRKLALPYVHLEKLYTGCRWAEGPAWFAAGRYLVWSDIPNDRMLRWDETDGSVSVFRQPAMNSNGNTVDLQGRLVSCGQRSRCVSRTELDGERMVLADRYDGVANVCFGRADRYDGVANVCFGRAEAQSAVHLRHDIALFRVPQHARGAAPIPRYISALTRGARKCSMSSACSPETGVCAPG